MKKPMYIVMYMLRFKFILGLTFIFLLFLGMVMSDNEFETMEKFKPRIKLNHNIIINLLYTVKPLLSPPPLPPL